MESGPAYSGDTGDSSERRIFYALGVIVLVVVTGTGVKKWRAKHAHHVRKHHHGAVKAIALHAPTVIAQPTTPPPGELALEIWVKNPESIASKILPRLAGPGITFSMMLKGGMPPESAKDLDELDLTKPLGWAILDTEASTTRFVVAATVKDAARARKIVEDYATREGAQKEPSAALATDTWRGAKTGRYMALIGQQVMLGSDKKALESAAARLGAGWLVASTQAHDVMARAPRSWVVGPFVKWVERSWAEWVTPQLGGATSGPAKALFDEIAIGAQKTWPGAEDLDVVVDVTDQSAVLSASLRAAPGSALSQFLATYPTSSPDSLLESPRDALGGIEFKFPPTWIETARKFLVTPPPGVEIPAELKAKTEAVFAQLGSVIEGEVVLSSVADAPPLVGNGTNLMRFKVRDDEGAKKAAREMIALLLSGPPGVPQPAIPPMTAITVDGGSGEAMEVTPAPQPGAAPIAPQGIAWLVRGGYLFVARGSSPRARVVTFASPKPEEHLHADSDLRTRLNKLPVRSAIAVFMAPFRASTPLPGAMGQPPLAQAITLALEPTATGLNAYAQLDLELTIRLAAPMFLHPAQPPPDGAAGMPSGGAPPGYGYPPGYPQQPPPGYPQQPPPGYPQQPPPGYPQQPPPGSPPGGYAPPPGGKKPPATPKSPPVAPPPIVAPVPTGYVLPLPKHQSKD